MQLAILLVGMALSVVAPSDPNTRVHDYSRILSVGDREQLEALARAVERETTAQLVVVTVPSLRGQTVDEYSRELFNTWGIGQ